MSMVFFPKYLMTLCKQTHKLNETKMSNSLSNKSDCMNILMQTLKVKLINKDKSMMIRLFDSGNKLMYLSKREIESMEYKPVAGLLYFSWICYKLNLNVRKNILEIFFINAIQKFQIALIAF